MRPEVEVTFVDVALADGTIHRRLSDGRQEWRTPADDGSVRWHDEGGRQGVDEPLGRRLVKRTIHDVTVLYGRDIGFGRTVWSTGVVTVNRTAFGGRVAAIIAAVTTASLRFTSAPPQRLSPEQEAQLRAEGRRERERSPDSDWGYVVPFTTDDDLSYADSWG